MSRFSNGYYLNGLFWQIFRVSCLAALLSLILSSNTTLAANSQPELIKVSLTPVTLSVPLPKQQRIDEQSSLILNLEGIEYTPSNVIPYDIYLNLPPGVTPNTDSPYYAGTLALFAYPQGATYSLNITDVVRRLRNDHLLQNDNLSITIVPPKPEQFLTTAQLERSSPRLSEPVIRFKRVSITYNSIKN